MPALPDLIATATASVLAYLETITSSPQQIVAHVAAAIGVAFVSVAALVRTMIPLRWLAVGSNVGLLIFGALHPSVPTLMVSCALLPINLWRALEMMRITRRVRRAASDADLAAIWLKPYMKPLRLRAGRVLFRKGDHANRLFLLTDGELELVEAGKRLEPGRIFGEIALFSPDRVRTNTVRCVTRCVVLAIHESTVRQLYFQNPSFGFHLIELLAARLTTDVGRAEERQARTEQLLFETESRGVYGMPAHPVAGDPSDTVTSDDVDGESDATPDGAPADPAAPAAPRTTPPTTPTA
jgi:CRP/FNR family transcriptional regulator, cyclic AMP receptor protein